MKKIEKMGAQGDVMFRRVGSIPGDAKRVETKGPVIVAHSETGHHHTVDGTGIEVFAPPGDAFVCYLRLAMNVDVVHHRPWDTHETLNLSAGLWEVRRQREYVPGGFRRVED